MGPTKTHYHSWSQRNKVREWWPTWERDKQLYCGGRRDNLPRDIACQRHLGVGKHLDDTSNDLPLSSLGWIQGTELTEIMREQEELRRMMGRSLESAPFPLCSPATLRVRHKRWQGGRRQDICFQVWGWTLGELEWQITIVHVPFFSSDLNIFIFLWCDFKRDESERHQYWW